MFILSLPRSLELLIKPWWEIKASKKLVTSLIMYIGELYDTNQNNRRNDCCTKMKRPIVMEYRRNGFGHFKTLMLCIGEFKGNVGNERRENECPSLSLRWKMGGMKRAKMICLGWNEDKGCMENVGGKITIMSFIFHHIKVLVQIKSKFVN